MAVSRAILEIKKKIVPAENAWGKKMTLFESFAKAGVSKNKKTPPFRFIQLKYLVLSFE